MIINLDKLPEANRLNGKFEADINVPAVMAIDPETNEYVLCFGNSPEDCDFRIPLGEYDTEAMAEIESRVIYAQVSRYIHQVIRSAVINVTT